MNHVAGSPLAAASRCHHIYRASCSTRRLKALCLPRLQRYFFQLLSREITEDQELITLLSRNSADARVATLLLGIAARKERHAQDPLAFRLPMSRSDIGKYLGLTLETVSRVFGRLRKLGKVAVDNKEVRILYRAALAETSGLRA